MKPLKQAEADTAIREFTFATGLTHIDPEYRTIRDIAYSRVAGPSQRRTEPPDEHKGWQWHWLDSERALHPCMSEWLRGEWYSANEVGPITPEEMARRGWDYHSPAVPGERLKPAPDGRGD